MDTSSLKAAGTSIGGLYARYSSDRNPYLDRARECSRLTIPTLMPPNGDRAGSRYPQPYQGVGARGVNNLASKLLLALFPANTPFFRLAIDDFDIEAMMARIGKKGRGTIEKALNKIERSVSQEVETSALRVTIHESLKLLIVAGNVVVYIDPKTGRSKAVPLDRFVVRRDPLGNVTEIIVEESIALVYIPESYRAKIIEKHTGDPLKDDSEVTLYTRVVKLDDGRWEAVQEVCEQIITETRGFYAADKCPWLALRMIPVPGEDYGRSFVEEQLGDLRTLEKLTKAIVQFAAAAAKIVFLVKPNAVTKVRKLSKAESGDFIEGKKDDIDVLQLEKYHDFQVAQSTAVAVKRDLEMAFLLNSAVQRNAERVTAEEIRMVARELDEGLGGVHSVLSQELQLPIVIILMWRKERAGKLPKLPKGVVKPMIITGVEALGRGTDLSNLNLAIAHLTQLNTVPQDVRAIMDLREYVDRVFASVGVDSDGLIKDEATVAQEQQQQMMQQIAMQSAPGAIQEVAKQGMNNGQE